MSSKKSSPASRKRPPVIQRKDAAVWSFPKWVIAIVAWIGCTIVTFVIGFRGEPLVTGICACIATAVAIILLLPPARPRFLSIPWTHDVMLHRRWHCSVFRGYNCTRIPFDISGKGTAFLTSMVDMPQVTIHVHLSRGILPAKPGQYLYTFIFEVKTSPFSLGMKQLDSITEMLNVAGSRLSHGFTYHHHRFDQVDPGELVNVLARQEPKKPFQWKKHAIWN